METLNPRDLDFIDPYTISFITLKNGNVIMIDEATPMKNNKGKNENKNLIISDSYNISFNDNDNSKKQSNKINNIKKFFINDFNKLSFPVRIVNFSYPNNNNKKSINNYRSSTFKENIFYEQNKYNKNKICKIYKEEKKNIENKIEKSIKRNKNYRERLEKFIEDSNKPTIKAVISLDIPSDIEHNISETQKKFNSMVSEFKKKKIKSIDEKRYYELYKTNNNKIYNDFYDINNNRLKYYQEYIFNEKEKKDNDSCCNNSKAKNLKNYNINKFQEINGYKWKNNVILNYLNDKRNSFSQKNIRTKIYNDNSELVFPKNIWNKL